MQDGSYRGAALNVAARLCGRAHGGEVIVSEGTSRLAGHLGGIQYSDRGRVHLKNIPEPVHILQAYSEHDAPPPNRWVLMFFGKPGRTLGWKLGLGRCPGRGRRRPRPSSYLTTGDTEGGNAAPTITGRRERRPGVASPETALRSERRARRDHACGALEGLPGCRRCRSRRNPDGCVPSAHRGAGPLGDLLVPERRRPGVGLPGRAPPPPGHQLATPESATPSSGAASSSGSTVPASPAATPSATSTATTPSSSGHTSVSVSRLIVTSSSPPARAGATTSA